MTVHIGPTVVEPRGVPHDPQGARLNDLPVIVIGAGPVGLAAAAHLRERGLEFTVLEASTKVGAAVRDWGHVPMFSPWRFDLDRACVALLERARWNAPDGEAFPTGHDLVEAYLEPLAATSEIAGRLRLGHRVTGVARAGSGKVRTAGRAGRSLEVRFIDDHGQESRLFGRAVIDATGTWSNPNPAGASGLPALGEAGAADRIRYGMPDVLGSERSRYAGKRVMVVGSGHSATGTLLDLAKLGQEATGTRVIWASRSTDFTRTFGSASDGLPARGALGQRLRGLVATGDIAVRAPFAVDRIDRTPQGIVMLGEGASELERIEVDEVIVATGLRPDLSFLGEVRLDLDPALECPSVLAPLIDPNIHSCGTVRPHGAAELVQPEPGLFIAGMKSYGRAPTFLLATGYEQVRSIAAHLAGDHAAAARVELVLPETGVCSGPAADSVDASFSCCAPKCRPTAA